MELDPRFARLLCARLCHDLGGPIGSLSGTLDLVADGDADMLPLARDTADALRARLRLYAAAWGGPTADADAASLGRLLAGSPTASRVEFHLDHLAPGGQVPSDVVPLALNAALLAAEALPRGGAVLLAGSAEDGLCVCPEGKEAAWPPALLAVLAGEDADAALEDEPRRVLAPLLVAMAGAAGWSVSLAQGDASGVAPLLLAPLAAAA